MPVYKILEEMPTTEIMEWRAYDLIEPIGDTRLDMNFAYIILFLNHVLGGNKKATLKDFLLNWESSVFTPAEIRGRANKHHAQKSKDDTIQEIYNALGIKR